MAKYFSAAKAPPVIHLDQLQTRYREIQDLREQVREAEATAAQRGMIRNSEISSIARFNEPT